MTLTKYLFPIILALMPIQAYAQPAGLCVPMEAALDSVPGSEAITGKDLRNYIDAFNKVTGGGQEYDAFDALVVVPLGNGKVGWAFVKDGCIIGTAVNTESLDRDIRAVINGVRVGP